VHAAGAFIMFVSALGLGNVEGNHLRQFSSMREDNLKRCLYN